MANIRDAYYPPQLDPSRLEACLGLISDTHIPQRWPRLPALLASIFQGVDLILHAGDVGELWVLDELSRIAPVTAVHGNDETEEATRELPSQQIISVAGRRILLWHSHYPNRQEEMASRRDDGISPARSLERARRAGASLVVFGHWHIPLSHRAEDILIVNPGAIASGNVTLRQTRQTVALLFVQDDGRFFVTHVDLNQPDRPFIPTVNWDAGFAANARHYSASIWSPRLTAVQSQLYEHLLPLAPEPLSALLHRLAHRCWAGEQSHITPQDLLQAIQTNPDIPNHVAARLEVILEGAAI